MSNRPVELIPVNQLDLDPENPRLPKGVQRNKQDMLEYLARETSIEELMTVIAENGFFGGEPLVAYKKKARHTVIEGNRRLVAVLLLHDPSLYPKRKRIAEIARAAKHKPNELPVTTYDSRDEVLTYLGYRHITGVKQWNPLAKARYMLQLFSRSDSRRSADARYREVAREIGSRRDHIERTLDALAVYDVIEARDFFDIDGLDEATLEFSLLTTAVAYPSIAEFVGSDRDPIVKPSVLKLDPIETFTRWMFQEKSTGETLVGESRNIKKLAAVAGSKVALAALKKGASLESAYRMTSGVKDEFVRHMYEAEGNLQSANSFATLVRPDRSVLDIASTVLKLARGVERTLQSASEDE